MFRMQMPRIYELRDLIDNPASPEAYFQNFDKSVQDSPHHVRPIYLGWEKELQGLDDEAWRFLKSEASPYLVRKDAGGRGWQQLFDILGQARAYNYLKAVGCSAVRFIPRAEKQGSKTPDLEGALGCDRVLCEVKTINISQREVCAREEYAPRSIAINLDARFFGKLSSDITNARNQLVAFDTTNGVQYCIYFNIHFDDILAECKERYFRQIDEYLSNNPVPGINLIFHNDKTAFYKPLAMTAATVDNA